MLRIELRHGFGFDIAFDETTCYHIHAYDYEDNHKEMLVQFQGVVLLLPFVRIEIGKLFEKDEWKLVKPTVH